MSNQGGNRGYQSELGGHQCLGDTPCQFTVFGIGKIRDLPEHIDHTGYRTK